MKHHHIPTVALLALVPLAGCSGRDPLVSTRNADALAHEGEGEGEGEGEPHVRTLGTRKLFGALPVEDRFLDPLFTMGTNGWTPVSSDFQSYAIFNARVIPTPTDTPALELADVTQNPQRVTLLGEYKGGRTREGVSVWLGRHTADAGVGFADTAVAVIGTFVNAGGGSVDLTAEPDSVTKGDVTWTRFSVILEEGPVGWANLYIEDPVNAALLVAGPSAVDVGPPGADALIRTAKVRASTAHERETVQVAHDRAHQRLAVPRPGGPPMLPGLAPTR